ncbi:hypothetical protein [Thiocystis violascens]|uniref:Uncharacterized protein n=1 Tax=Thiocystis violascens (strain ATCC 17096 / DSM 198 / 6111) TaxID=765911 RepID=I3Y5H6_THIV6|nr:hypothetical protein [Thiocystis violascens]AFL72244.1 hypothetical protein Thivi_0170 [Thiocystis violascens DSM 198]
MSDPSLSFFKTFVALYQEIIAHDGYGDIEVNIRLLPGRKKEVRLRCGREYRYLVVAPSSRNARKRYRVIEECPGDPGYRGPERRSTFDRRDDGSPRRNKSQRRDFRLERRIKPERRRGRGRRHDD